MGSTSKSPQPWRRDPGYSDAHPCLLLLANVPEGLKSLHSGATMPWAVLVYLSCYNKVPEIGYFINHRGLFLILEAGQVQVKVLAGLVSGEGCSPLPRPCLRPSSTGSLVLTSLCG